MAPIPLQELTMTTTHIYCLLFTGYQTLDLMGPVELLSRLPDVHLHFVSHSGGLIDSAQGFAVATDRLDSLRSGSILAQGTPSDVVTEETVKEVFGISSKVVPDPVSGAPLVMPIGRHRVKGE